ncbi:MAG TPA: hypothetical protein VF192_14855 [Longimicrobiales bacterium]
MKRGLLLFLAVTSASASPLAAPLAAQGGAPARFSSAARGEATALPEQPSFRLLRVAKWSTAALTAAAAGFGLAAHSRADELYRELEKACVADPRACSERLPNGAYADPRLEALYQDVLRHDSRARLMLIGSQIGVAATVLFFVLDLHEDSTPPNIPFDPRLLRLAPGSRGGVEVGVAVPVGPS